jgi:mRNA interferase RelE/StbE
MTYTIHITTSAQRHFEKLPSSTQDVFAVKMLSLETVPRPHGIQKLRGMNFLRMRCGDYRMIYAVDDQRRLITILDIGHRKEIYRKF